MAEIWVVNASPLIALAKVGHVDLLAAPGRSVVVPAALDPKVVEWSPVAPSAGRWGRVAARGSKSKQNLANGTKGA